MRDPLGVWTAGPLDVTCQIVRVESAPGGTLVDIMTLEPSGRGLEDLPAGTVLMLGFGSGPASNTRSNLESTVVLWEATCVPVHLHADEMAHGLRYHFSDRSRELTLLVADRPPDDRA